MGATTSHWVRYASDFGESKGEIRKRIQQLVSQRADAHRHEVSIAVGLTINDIIGSQSASRVFEGNTQPQKTFWGYSSFPSLPATQNSPDPDFNLTTLCFHEISNQRPGSRLGV
jgi:hypothetical protein